MKVASKDIWNFRGHVVNRVAKDNLSYWKVFKKLKNGKPKVFQFEASNLKCLLSAINFFDEIIETPVVELLHPGSDDVGLVFGEETYARPNPETVEVDDDRPNKE